MDDTIIVIPARFNSQRFPGKVLYPLMGKPVLKWVLDSAINSKIAKKVIIATEDKKVLDFASSINAEAKLTSESCKSGSDRVWEVARKINCKFVINLQADEPFINPEVIRESMAKLKKEKADIATACAPIIDKKEILNPNCVKVAMNKNGMALYFSRHPIPYHHELSELSKKYPYYKHCGFYIYKKEALEKFVKAKQTQLEILERLEQLRALENGMKISVHITDTLGPAIDTFEDIKNAEKYYKKIIRR